MAALTGMLAEAVESVVVGPDDLLVIRLPTSTDAVTLDELAAQILERPALAGRVALVCADQIVVVRGGRKVAATEGGG